MRPPRCYGNLEEVGPRGEDKSKKKVKNEQESVTSVSSKAVIHAEAGFQSLTRL